jgi:hypothetical protein
MRIPALCLATLAALAGCKSEENVVLSGYPPVIISPVRSSISAAVNFTDATGAHPQWIIAMTDVPDLCTKVTAHRDYFQTPIENFNGILLWVPPGNLGTFFVGQMVMGSQVNNEVIVGSGPGSPQVVRLAGVSGFGANIALSQFNVGAGGEAVGNFDVLIADPAGIPREFAGKFKATYCTGFEQAQVP